MSSEASTDSMPLAAVVFLSVWLTGWSVGGVFATSFLLGSSVNVAGAVVWLVLFGSFAFNSVLYGDKRPVVLLWLFVWICFGFWGALFRLSCGKRFRNRVPGLLARWNSRFDAYCMRLRYFAASCTKERTAAQQDGTFLSMMTVSVHTASGEDIISNAQLLSHDYVSRLRDMVESKLLPEGKRDTRLVCQLICDTTVLVDSDRLCHAGVVDGSAITAVIMQQDSEAMLEEPQAKVDVPPIPVRLFLLLWLCGWFAGEVSTACILQRAALGL